MKSDFKLANLVGTVYRAGNLVFSEDGNQLLSPVGNRVSCFDLVNNRSFTFSYQHRKNIARIALNRQGTLMISVDEDGRGILVNFAARVVLHHFNFKGKVHDLQFSHDGHYIAAAVDRFVQIWHTPDMAEDRQYAPFVRHRVYAGHYNDVVSVTWSADLRFLVSTSKDLTLRIFSLHSEDKEAKVTLTGHRDYVMRAFFSHDQETIFTVSKDGAVFQYEYLTEEEAQGLDEPAGWRIIQRHFFHVDGVSVKCAEFHSASAMLVVGFSNGEFRLYELPAFTMIQQLAMGQDAVDAVSINPSGEWLAFGLAKKGQLLVYEWQSESYILKQQGHFDAMNALCYLPDGARAVTASEDGKIKVWDVVSGFCLYTFTEHTSGVSAVQFARRGHVMFSASLDGTVRAWDLIRFRNFRTFTAPQRVQFKCLAVDPSGEVVVAGLQHEFDIFVWSVQTGALLDALAGHEGPVLALAFGAESSVLASASWDKTIRIWNIFSRTQTTEPIEVEHDTLALAVRPDSKEVAVSTLSGHLMFYDVEAAAQTHILDIRKDVAVGRHLEDRFELKNSARAKHFTTVAYSFDGDALLAGGNNNSICLYNIADEVLLKRFVVSENMSLDGTLTMLNSLKITDAGVSADLLDTQGELSDREDRVDESLPGSHRGDPAMRRLRPLVRVTLVQFSPTNAAFAAATTEGLLVFSTDSAVVFDPFELDLDVTPHNIAQALADKDWTTALVMAFRLNERHLLDKVCEGVPVLDIELVARDVPAVYVGRMLHYLGEKMNRGTGTHHIEFNLLWVKAVFAAHGVFINKHKTEMAPQLRLVSRFLARVAKDVVEVSRRSGYTLEYVKEGDGESGEDGEDDVENDDDAEWHGPNGKHTVDPFEQSGDEMEE